MYYGNLVGSLHCWFKLVGKYYMLLLPDFVVNNIIVLNTFHSLLSTSSCRLFRIAKMSAIKGLSKNMSRPKAKAPGELYPNDELQTLLQACIAVDNVSSMTRFA